jgi:hypothetical protein
MERNLELTRISKRIEKIEHDIREVSQCIVYICECVKEIHSNITEA